MVTKERNNLCKRHHDIILFICALFSNNVLLQNNNKTIFISIEIPYYVLTWIHIIIFSHLIFWFYSLALYIFISSVFSTMYFWPVFIMFIHYILPKCAYELFVSIFHSCVAEIANAISSFKWRKIFLFTSIKNRYLSIGMIWLTLSVQGPTSDVSSDVCINLSVFTPVNLTHFLSPYATHWPLTSISRLDKHQTVMQRWSNVA